MTICFVLDVYHFELPIFLIEKIKSTYGKEGNVLFNSVLNTL